MMSTSLRQFVAVASALLIGVVLLVATPQSAAMEQPVLRVLKLRHHELNHAHRDTAGEYRLLADFARRYNYQLEWADAVLPASLENELARGHADLILSDATVSETPRGLPAGLPMGRFDYVVYGHTISSAQSPLDFKHMRVAVSLASPLWPYLNRLQQLESSMQLVVLPDDTTRGAILRGIEHGDYDAAVVAVARHENLLEASPRLKRLFTLSSNHYATWRYAYHNDVLRQQMDSFLERYHTAVLAPQPVGGDWADIQARHVLRVITRIDPHNYYLKNGRPTGFEHDMVRKFATARGLTPEFLIAESDEQALEWLRQGIGDVLATRINIAEVAADPGLHLSRRYFHNAPVVVSHKNLTLDSLAALNGRRVAVLANSVEHRTASQILASGKGDFVLAVVGAQTSSDEMSAALRTGRYDAAIIDAASASQLHQEHNELAIGTSIASDYHYGWTTRTANRDLGREINQFLVGNFRKETYNLLARRYFERPRALGFERIAGLSPFDELVREYALDADFDWRLIVAQMYHESQFNPVAESMAGAQGLMQLLPSTAQSVGVSNPFDPEDGIRGGIAYLSHLRDRFDPYIAPRERTWFAIAAYNIGFHRVTLARREAARRGLDPDRWFGHTEAVMRDWSKRSDRPCGCGQTVAYVRGIRSLYNSYHQLDETLTAGLGKALLYIRPST